MQHCLRFHSNRRSWMLGGVIVAATTSLALAGCSASDLGLSGTQCTPQTCDFFVNRLVAVTTAGKVTLLADSTNQLFQYDGSTWQKVSDENASQREALLASPNFGTDQTLFLGNTSSTDGGKTWLPTCAAVIAVSPDYANDKLVFGKDATVGASASATTATVGAGTPTPLPKPTGCPTTQGSFYTSSNGGTSWNTVTGPQGAGDPDQFVVSPTFKTDQTIFATFTVNLVPSLYKSTDGGQTWKKVLDNRQDVVAVSTNFSSDKTVFAVATDAVRSSTDGGQTWKNVTTPLAATKVKEIAFSPNYSQDKQLILVSAYVDMGSKDPHGVFGSTDGGASWQQINPDLTQRAVNYPAVLFSPGYATDKTLYTASLDQAKGPAVSTDNGQTWSAFNNGLTLATGVGG